MRSWAVILLAFSSSGCAVAMQAIVGWDEVTEDRIQQHQAVAVETFPPGAPVERVTPEGEVVGLGPSPLTDQVDYTVARTTRTPKLAAQLWTTLAELTVGLGLFGLAVGLQQQSEEQIPLPLFLGAAIPTMGGAIDGVILLLRSLGSASEVELAPSKQRYVARFAGLEPVERTIDVSAVSEVRLAVAGDAVEPAPDWVVAVMSPENATSSSVSAALGDQLRASLAMFGIPTIDRGVQAEALHTLVQETKLESYRPCYDDACQIELGRALAATHILRTQIRDVGSCLVTTVLVDLATEVAVHGFTASVPCEPAAIVGTGKAAVTQILEDELRGAHRIH